MKHPVTRKFSSTAIAIGIFTLFALVPISSLTQTGFIAGAEAAQGGDNGHKGAGGEGQGGTGKKGSGQGGKSTSEILEADDDSDRPAWAGGNTGENPHSGGGQSGGGGKTDKGDLYSDLWLFLRDPVTGVPLVLTSEEWSECADACYMIYICADEACSTTVPYPLSTDPDAELPAGVVPIETDLGRLNLGRAPDKVLDKAADEALSKITADGAVFSLDPAGRIVIDGATIDSPLENLSLYIALMNEDAEVKEALQPLMTETGVTQLELAAILLASAADKTGDVLTQDAWYGCCDLVWYVNQIYGIASEQEPYDFSDVTYDRSYYDTEIDYNYYDEDGVTVLNGTVNIKDYLESQVKLLEEWSGILLFSVASDDALQVVELIHTQIHDDVLPGTVE